MASALSQPIGPKLLNSRPLIYLPTGVRRRLLPLAALLGRVQAVAGFQQQPCCGPGESSCWTFASPLVPSFTHVGLRNFEISTAYALPTPAGQLDLELDLEVIVTKVGHYQHSPSDVIQREFGKCPEACESAWIKGNFGAEVTVSLALGGDFPDYWNNRVVGDAIFHLTVLPSPFLHIGIATARRILGDYIVPQDGKASFSGRFNLGSFTLTPP